MRSTVRHEISEAVAAYEDKARDQWLFDYPAQVCVLIFNASIFSGVDATQDVWTIQTQLYSVCVIGGTDG